MRCDLLRLVWTGFVLVTARALRRGRGRVALRRQQEGDERLHVLALELHRLHASLQHIRPRRMQQRRQLRRRVALAEVGDGEETAAAMPLRAMAPRAEER